MIDQQHDSNPQAQSQTNITTEVAQRRQRVFLRQTVGERVLTILWAVVRFSCFRFSPPFANRWRVMLLNLFGASVHASARIAPSAQVDFPWNLIVEPHVTICHEVIINCMGTVRIGEYSRISQYSHICAGTHDYQRRDMSIVRSPITIGKSVWIAADAFVGPDVTIGDGCMLAARSSAFGDLPANQICLGEPAVPHRQRFTGESGAAVTRAAAQAN